MSDSKKPSEGPVEPSMTSDEIEKIVAVLRGQCPVGWSPYDKPVQTTAQLAAQIRSARQSDLGLPSNNVNRQLLCVARELSEMIGAFLRYFGQSRRGGSSTELRHELANAVLSLYVFAHMLGIDLDQAAQEKFEIIMNRGFSEEDGK